MQPDLNKLLAVSYIYVSRDRVDARNVFGGFLPFILAVGDVKPGQELDPSAISTRLRNSFGWQVGGDFVALYQDDLIRHGFIVRDGQRLRWTEKAALPDETEPRQKMSALKASFFEFSTRVAGKFLENRSADERLHDLATSLVSNRLFSEDALEELAKNDASENVADEKTDTIDYVCAKYVRHCYSSEPESYEALVTLSQLGIVCQLATFFARPPPAERVNRKLTIALDGPFLVDLLGFGGDDRRSDAELTIKLARKRKARIAVFSHSLDEAQDVVRGVLINEPSMRFGPTAAALRRGGISQAILDAFVQTPRRIVEKTKLVDEIIEQNDRRYSGRNDYFNTEDWQSLYAALANWKDTPRTRDCDSVRNVMRLRADTASKSVWNAQVVLLSSNQELARISKQICVARDLISSDNIGPVVSRFQLAALLWLDGGDDEKTEIVSTHLMAAASAFLTRDRALVGKVQRYAWNVGKERKELVEAFVSQPLTYEFLQDATLGGVRRVDDGVVSDVLQRLVEHGRQEGADIERAKIATELEGGRKVTLDAKRDAEEATVARREAETLAAEAQKAKQEAEEEASRIEAAARREMERSQKARSMVLSVIGGQEDRWNSRFQQILRGVTACRWIAVVMACGIVGFVTALTTTIKGLGVITFLLSVGVASSLLMTRLVERGRIMDRWIAERLTRAIIESERQAFNLQLGPSAPDVEVDVSESGLTIRNREIIADALMS